MCRNVNGVIIVMYHTVNYMNNLIFCCRHRLLFAYVTTIYNLMFFPDILKRSWIISNFKQQNSNFNDRYIPDKYMVLDIKKY